MLAAFLRIFENEPLGLEAESILAMASVADFNFPPLTIAKKEKQMNAHSMQVLAQDMEAEYDKLPGVVVPPLKQYDPEEDVEHKADVHRKLSARYAQLTADTRKNLKATIASLEGDRRSLKSQYEADMVFVAERIADARADASRQLEALKKLAGSSKAALDVLVE